MQLAAAILLACLLVPLASLNTGCQTIKAQRTLLKASDSLGLAANSAVDALGEVLTLRAIDELGDAATEETVTAWILDRPEWARARVLHAQFFGAYEVWIKGNAAAVSSDTIRGVDITLVVSTAQELFSFVGQFVPAIAKWEAVAN